MGALNVVVLFAGGRFLCLLLPAMANICQCVRKGKCCVCMLANTMRLTPRQEGSY